MIQLNKIGLGTAQWGMSYGVANRRGQPRDSEIDQMLTHAKKQGVKILDTAYAYGEAEIILGEQGANVRGFDVVTKTVPLDSRVISKKEIVQLSTAFLESLDRLKLDVVYGLLVHRGDNLLSPGGDLLWRKLQELKAQKRVSRIGVSIYRPQQLEEILGRYDIDLVQVPYNIYDQRFALTGLFQRLKQKGIEVHIRSAFLQGLLLMKPDELPEQFGVIRDHQAKLHNRLDELGITPLQGCLSHCLNQPDIDKIVVGCETLGQLIQILSIAEKSPGSTPNLESYAMNDERFIDPSKWLQ